MSLSEKSCLPCRGGTLPLTRQEFDPLFKELRGWQVVDDKKLTKSYKFDGFAPAMALANKIAQLSEVEGHHPDLLIRWGELKIELWTHKIDGLSESDFILASKIDLLT